MDARPLTEAAAEGSEGRGPLIPVILAGGLGSRLWPMSRALFPKQFQAFFGGRSLLQNTLLRAAKVSVEPPILVCNEAHRFAAAQQCEALALPWRCIVLEAEGRNTAPAIAVAAHIAVADHAQAQLLVLPSDHLIDDVDGFKAVVEVGALAAAQGKLVTFGVRPGFPETGYGYIELDIPERTPWASLMAKGSGSGAAASAAPEGTASAPCVAEGADAAATASSPAPLESLSVRSFVEKPDWVTAQALVRSGSHFWNSGMFLFNAQIGLAEIEAHSPQMAQAVVAAYRQGRSGQAWSGPEQTGEKPSDAEGGSGQAGPSSMQKTSPPPSKSGFFRPGPAFLDSPAGSFDKVVMEKTDRAAVVPMDVGWADVGSWRAIGQAIPADARGNRIQGDVVALDADNNLIQAQNRLVGALGVSNLTIVETADAVLVADRGRVQDVGALADQLKHSGRSEHGRHCEVFRPWGSWRKLHEGPRFKIRRLKLKPGAGITLPKHRHRAEHWVVVQGVAEITGDGRTFTLDENCGAQTPQGSAHRLRNAGQTPLELIEVQVGEQLDEDEGEGERLKEGEAPPPPA